MKGGGRAVAVTHGCGGTAGIADGAGGRRATA
jgi:hypothetical protein